VDPGFIRLEQTQDHDNPRHYMTIVEFPSYELAMANSTRPETDEMARELAARWRGRLITAHLESWRLGALSELVVPFVDGRRRRRRPRPPVVRTALSVALAVGLVVHLAF